MLTLNSGIWILFSCDFNLKLQIRQILEEKVFGWINFHNTLGEFLSIGVENDFPEGLWQICIEPVCFAWVTLGSVGKAIPNLNLLVCQFIFNKHSEKYKSLLFRIIPGSCLCHDLFFLLLVWVVPCCAWIFLFLVLVFLFIFSFSFHLIICLGMIVV